MSNYQIDEPRKFESCVRADTAQLEFNIEFSTWMIMQNIGQGHDCHFFCMGWEL